MALIWSETREGMRYEVRSAGSSIRLYTDGILHSQWNPNTPLSGHLWDLLVLPTFFSSVEILQDILVLGVGGGSAINAINHFFSPTNIIGVDLDPMHLKVAKRFFKCRRKNTHLIRSEAKSFLEKEQHRFDYIIEDLFLGSTHDKSDARRAIVAEENWFRNLSNRLTDEGILVANFESKDQLMKFLLNNSKKKLGFKKVYIFQALRYENAIGVFLKSPKKLSTFYAQLEKAIGPSQSARIANHFIVSDI